MRLEHHLVGGYVRYISPYIILLLTVEWWTPNSLATARRSLPAWSMPMARSLSGCDSRGIMDTRVFGIILVSFYRQGLCSGQEWSNSSLGFTHV